MIHLLLYNQGILIHWRTDFKRDRDTLPKKMQ